MRLLLLGLLLAVSAVSAQPVQQGGQFRVNTPPSHAVFRPAVARNADGDFVVAWTGNQEGSDIYARRYDALGAAQGSEFRVNTFRGYETEPSIAMDPDGDFVVVWTSSDRDGSNEGVYAQLFDALGAPRGDEFRVNTTTVGRQRYHSVAMDAGGNFVVVWESLGLNYDPAVISGQRYDASGTAQGTEFQVTTSMTGWPQSPSVSMAGNGEFVVAWYDFVGTTSTTDLYARSYDAAGGALGPEFLVNTNEAGSQVAPSVARNASGDFVIAWETYVADGTVSGGYARRVYARRYAAGGALGPEFLVSTNGAGSLAGASPSVGIAASGDFVVAWTDAGPNGSDAYARFYSASGVAVGGGFLVNSVTAGNQLVGGAGMASDGDFVLVWLNIPAGGGEWDVYGQLYNAGAVAGEPSAGVSSAAGVSVQPNPARGPVVVTVAAVGPVRVSVVDALGREVAAVLDSETDTGERTVGLDTSGWPAGVYFVRAEASGRVVTSRLVVAR